MRRLPNKNISVFMQCCWRKKDTRWKKLLTLLRKSLVAIQGFDYRLQQTRSGWIAHTETRSCASRQADQQGEGPSQTNHYWPQTARVGIYGRFLASTNKWSSWWETNAALSMKQRKRIVTCFITAGFRIRKRSLLTAARTTNHKDILKNSLKRS